MSQTLNSAENTLGKVCLVGLSYFSAEGQLLQNKILAGIVTKISTEQGISLRLHGEDGVDFILPHDLTCWFIAPAGVFHTSNGIKIQNPDYLITWDIYQCRAGKAEGEHQWWEWVPRQAPPSAGLDT